MVREFYSRNVMTVGFPSEKAIRGSFSAKYLTEKKPLVTLPGPEQELLPLLRLRNHGRGLHGEACQELEDGSGAEEVLHQGPQPCQPHDPGEKCRHGSNRSQ